MAGQYYFACLSMLTVIYTVAFLIRLIPVLGINGRIKDENKEISAKGAQCVNVYG